MNLGLVFLPLLCSIGAGFFGFLIGNNGAAFLTVICLGCTLMLCFGAFYNVAVCGSPCHVLLFPWFDSDLFSVSEGFLLNLFICIFLYNYNEIQKNEALCFDGIVPLPFKAKNSDFVFLSSFVLLSSKDSDTCSYSNEDRLEIYNIFKSPEKSSVQERLSSPDNLTSPEVREIYNIFDNITVEKPLSSSPEITDWTKNTLTSPEVREVYDIFGLKYPYKNGAFSKGSGKVAAKSAGKTVNTKVGAVKAAKTKVGAVKAVKTKVGAVKAVKTKVGAVKAVKTKVGAVKAAKAKMAAVKLKLGAGKSAKVGATLVSSSLCSTATDKENISSSVSNSVQNFSTTKNDLSQALDGLISIGKSSVNSSVSGAPNTDGLGTINGVTQADFPSTLSGVAQSNFGGTFSTIPFQTYSSCPSGNLGHFYQNVPDYLHGMGNSFLAGPRSLSSLSQSYNGFYPSYYNNGIGNNGIGTTLYPQNGGMREMVSRIPSEIQGMVQQNVTPYWNRVSEIATNPDNIGVVTDLANNIANYF